MWKKALILFSCLLLLSGCALIADSGTKKELMEQMDKLMDHHDSNMKAQRTMISDFNTASQSANTIKQSLNQGSALNQNQFNSLSTSLTKVNTELSLYRTGVDKLLNELVPVKVKANELKNVEAKSRATKYLDSFQKATESQKAYIDNFQNIIDSYQTYFTALSKGQFPDDKAIQQYFDKEGQLVDNFNKEIDAFNQDWTLLNKEDFNREVKKSISF
jgi:hypothetical protein